MSINKVIDLAKKLKALADQGVGGEKLNAAEKLKQLLDKHNLTIEDVEGEKKQEFKFVLENEEQDKFWHQVCASVLGIDFSVYTYSYNKRSKERKYTRFVKCTPGEYIEIKEKLDFYWRALLEEQKIFRKAFIQKNKLYAKPKGDDERQEREYTLEERQEMIRMFAMMEGIEQKSYLKRIG